MPHGSESLGIIAGANKQLANTAAPEVAGLARMASSLATIMGPFFDLMSNNAFSTNYRNRYLGGLQQQEAQVRMQEQQMRMKEEEMEMNRQQLLDIGTRQIAAHTAMMTEYGDVIWKWQHHFLSDDDAKAQIADLNNKTGHNFLGVKLDNEGIGAVQQYLDWEDKRLHDNWNAYASLYEGGQKKKAQTGDQTDDWSKSNSSGTRAGLLGDPIQTQDPQTGDPTKPTAAPTIEKLSAKYPDLGEHGVNAALEMSETGKIAGVTDTKGPTQHPERYHDAMALSGDIDKAVGNILSSNEDRAQKIKDLEGIDPAIAQKVRDLSNYKELPTGLDNPHVRGKFVGWAHELNPKYDQSAAESLKQYFNPNGKEQIALRQANNLPNIHVQTLRDLAGDEPIITAKLKQAWNNEVGADPHYILLANQLRQELVAINTIQNGTGGIRVTLLEHMMDTTKPTLPASTIRQVLNQDLAETFGRVADVQGTFERYGRTEFAPGLTKHGWQMFSGILRTDAYGQVPTDAPPELQAVSRKGPAGSGLPPTEQQARGAKAYIAAHANDVNPSPDVVKNLQHARTLTSSTVSDAPWEHMPEDAQDND